MDKNEDEKEISAQTWGKLNKSLHQEGFREGSSAGRDETFQKGFDLGYEDGFQIGYKLGLHNGILKYFSSSGNHDDSALKEQLSTSQPHENPSRGLCVICEEEQRAGNSQESVTTSIEFAGVLADIRELQKKVNKQSFCTENIAPVLKSVNLDKLVNS